MFSFLSFKGILPAGALLLVCLGTRSDSLATPSQISPRLAALPRVTLWAWERREDLRSLNPHRYAVATLDQTLSIGLSVTSRPNLNLVALPGGIARIPVVRIEPSPHAILDDVARREAVAAILRSAHEPGVSHLVSYNQLDNFRGNWWCNDWGGRFNDDPWLSILPATATAPPAYFTARQNAAASAEFSRLQQLPCPPAFLGRSVLDDANAHPDDANVPEALALTVRATHYACLSWGPTPEHAPLRQQRFCQRCRQAQH